MSSSVKQQFIQDMQLAGLAQSTQKVYLASVMRFVRFTRTRPQDATEAQVAEYLRGLISQGQCHGTIQQVRGALQFIFQNTLQRRWGLFKKRLLQYVVGVCPRPRPTPIVAA
jgi:site-specific recombinase XerD